MTQPFEIGQQVVCTDGDFSGSNLDTLNWKYITPEEGETYTIRAVEPYWENGHEWAVRLGEIVNEEHYYSALGRSMEAHWKATRFVPA